MLKWLIVVAVCTLLLGFFSRPLRKLGLGRLPGDLHFRKGGQEYYIPITSTVVVSLLLTLITRFI